MLSIIGSGLPCALHDTSSPACTAPPPPWSRPWRELVLDWREHFGRDRWLDRQVKRAREGACGSSEPLPISGADWIRLREELGEPSDDKRPIATYLRPDEE